MEQNEVLITLVQIVTLVAMGISGYVTLTRTQRAFEQRVSGDFQTLAERVSRIEGFMESMGKDFAKRLHRDDDKYGIDHLLDRYIERHHELSFDEWEELKKQCEIILSRDDLTALEVSGFTWLKHLALHKLTAKPIRLRTSPPS